MAKKISSTNSTGGTSGTQDDQAQADQDNEKTFPCEVIVINETPRQWVMGGVPIEPHSETPVMVNDEAMLCKLQGDCAQLMQLYPDYVSVDPDALALRVLEALSASPATTVANPATPATPATPETKA